MTQNIFFITYYLLLFVGYPCYELTKLSNLAKKFAFRVLLRPLLPPPPPSPTSVYTGL